METYGLFLEVDKYANAGYSLRCEKAYSDGHYWCTGDNYLFIQEIQLDIEQHNLWLVKAGLKMCEDSRKDAAASYQDCLNRLADLESKFTLITHQPAE